MSMFSLAFEPKNSIVSVPSWPSMVSLPSRIHWKTSSPTPRNATSLPLSPAVFAIAAEEHVGALPAQERVVAGPAIDGQLDDAGGQRGGRHGVVAAHALITGNRWLPRRW